MSNDKFNAYVKTQAFAAQLAEFGFSVQIFVQRMESGGGGVAHFAYGAGNIFARREHARRWIKQQEQDDYMENIGMSVECNGDDADDDDGMPF